MTRIYYDTEFIEDGASIVLISIGMVTDDGRSYYAVNGDVDQEPDGNWQHQSGKTTWQRVMEHPWLRGNVVPHLPITDADQLARHNANAAPLFGPRPVIDGVRLDRTHSDVKPRYVIANEVRDFIQAAGPDVELWAWYGAYDHVALCWLWGRMIDLPDGVPMWTNDLRQERRRLGEPEMPRQADGEHNALADALHNRDMARFLDQYAQDHTEGPLRFSQSGWTVTLDQTKDLPAYVQFKHHDALIASGYIHPNPPGAPGLLDGSLYPTNLNTAPGMVVTELLPDVDDDSR